MLDKPPIDEEKAARLHLRTWGVPWPVGQNVVHWGEATPSVTDSAVNEDDEELDIEDGDLAANADHTPSVVTLIVS